MVLSDWEKQRDSERITTWTNQKQGKRGELVEISKVDGGWRFLKMIGNETTINKKFNTKPQAMNYAKSYMRTH